MEGKQISSKIKQNVDGYKIFEISEQPVVTASSTPWKPQAGSIIKFGKYDWRVLEIQGNKALLLADKVTHVNVPYNEECSGVTWETCTLRKWLNSEFLIQEFTPWEQGSIALTSIQNESNQWYGTKGTNATSDKIFLLSISEVVKYFGDSGQLNNRPNKNMSYVDDNYNNIRIAKSISKGNAAWWWLRTPGIGNHAAFVSYDGLLLVHGYRVDNDNGRGGVRPALFLNL
jgi:hypothetical protein